MKILKSWLKDFYSEDIPNERLLEIFRLAGFDVEEVISSLDENVIVAKIVKLAKHPNADKLRIANVTDGVDDFQIVCGAPNIAEGQLVPLAKIGAKIQGQEIKQAEIRGEISFGMLCSERELGIGDDHSGIKILPQNCTVGEKLANYFNSDMIIDLDITANRGDCLSHMGVAREVAVYENQNAKKEPIHLKKSSEKYSADEISIKVHEPELCSQYFARVISGAKIGPSPEWLQKRLIACGAKPINNVVDITNYIMLDLGHPMHAFDAKKIKDGKIIVRNAKKNEDILTLDGEIRHLDQDMLVISDPEKAIAIAGVMGAKNSEVDEETETIILEAAEFNSKSIRATAKKLNLTTEASYRFERGIDSDAIEYTINKAANLITEIAGGKVLSGIVSVGEKTKRNKVKIESKKINNLLGSNLSTEEINHILRHLGFEIEDDNATVPSWRHDISIWQDLAEEIGRVFGYDKIFPLELPKIKPAKKTFYYAIEKIKDTLVDSGFSETMNYPFLSESDIVAAKLDPKNLLEVANPIQPENRYLRNSLIPGILKDVGKNSSFDSILLFEIGHVFSKTSESVNLSIVTSGKNTVEIDEVIFKLSENFDLEAKHFNRKNYIRQELSAYKIKKPSVTIEEINLTKSLSEKINKNIKLQIAKNEVHYRGVSKFPALTRDLAFIVSKKINGEKIADEIYPISDLINRVELFDEFASDKFGADKKNLAYHIYLQAIDRTLRDFEADEIITRIIESVEKKFSAKLRKA